MKDSIFGAVPIESVKKSKFDLTHDVKVTGNMGMLIPVLVEECLPGESWKWNGNLLCRLAPLLAPIMHRVKATMHCFHVPNRILTTVWKDVITGGPDNVVAVAAPTWQVDTLLGAAKAAGQPTFVANFGSGSLSNYMGMPQVPYDAAHVYVDTQKINALPWLAYQCIWQYYYKDQNVDTTDVMESPIAGGPISTADMMNKYNVLRTRAWNKDPFTSALPWPQRGPQVLLPMSGAASILYLNESLVKTNTGANPNINTLIGTNNSSPSILRVNKTGAAVDGISGRIENIDSVEFNNSTVTINDVRTAFVVQQWQETNARGGARYNESILAHFDTMVPDFRLDQPEYIGGGTQQIQISEVVATAWANDGTDEVAQGNMSGHGISVGGSNNFFYNVKEHGWIMVILSIMPETSYQQGIAKKFLRSDRMTYPWPSFAGLGEQSVINREVYWDPKVASATNDTVWGYQQRYWELKAIMNRTCGEFETTLDYWTMTRKFAALPTLNSAFIYSDPTTRIYATTDASHKLWMQVVHQLSVLRPFPYYSVPGLLKM